MILDKESLFSDAQALTNTSAASENYIDFGAREIAFGDPLEILIQAVETFEGGTSVKFSLQTDDEITFSGATTLVETAAIAAADLVAGYRCPIKHMPSGNLGYVRLYYTVVGTFTAGKITAGIVNGSQQGHHDIPVAITGS